MDNRNPGKQCLADSSAGIRHRIIWIDGVGGYMLCSNSEVVIGQAVSGSPADLTIVGDLSRQALAIRRSGDDYFLQPIQEVRVDGQTVTRPQLLRNGQLLDVGTRVQLKFSKPSPLSSTARLDLTSHHRWKSSVDGVLLLGDTCVFGPRQPSHVLCPLWHHEILLFNSGDDWLFRSSAEMYVDGIRQQGSVTMSSGLRIEGEEFSLSIE